MTQKTNKTVNSLQDLADLAGVSRATASRALSDNPIISEKTRKKLQSLARQHNYSVNRQARDFRLRRTSVISVVFMLDIRSQQHMSDPFFLDMLGGIADSLAEHDYDLLLAHAPISNVADLREGRVLHQSDGIIFIGQGEQHEQLDALAKGDKPIVVWGQPVAKKHYPVVGSDNFQGGYKATEHLVAMGRRKVAFFGNTNNPENAARFEGYLQALHDSGIEPDPGLRVDVPFDMHSAGAVIREFAATGAEPDAVMCVSDVMALAAQSTFRDLGLHVPDDIAVVGYDDITLAAYASPPLTTISQSIHKAGQILVTTVLGLIRGEEVGDTILESKLVVRKSSGYLA